MCSARARPAHGRPGLSRLTTQELCFVFTPLDPPEPRAWRTGYSTGDPAALWYRFTKNMVIVYGTTDTLNVRTRVTKRRTPVFAA